MNRYSVGVNRRRRPDHDVLCHVRFGLPGSMHPIRCRGCGQMFEHWQRVRFCCESCAVLHRLRLAKVSHQPRPCEHCETVFTPARKDARFCSGKCRVAAHRVRQEA